MTETNSNPGQDRAAPAATVGDIMSSSMSKAVKAIVIFISILIYLAGIIYAEVHGLNMLTKGVNPEFLIWAYIGMLALGLSAIALPLALHFWTFATMQRIFTFGFYAFDLALLILNAFLDYATNTGGEIAGWGQLYLTYIMPATPVLCAIGWSAIWLLDPSTKAHVLRQTLKNSILEAKANQIANAARHNDVTQAVNSAADQEVAEALTELFGRPVSVTRPAQPTQQASQQPAPSSPPVYTPWWKRSKKPAGTVTNEQTVVKQVELKEQPKQEEPPAATDASFPG